MSFLLQLKRLHAKPWFWMVVVALLLRVALIVGLKTYDFPDPALGMPPKIVPVIGHFSFGYETGAIARSLAVGQGFSSPFGGNTGPTAWLAPIYPYMCSLVFRVFGLFTLQSAFVILFINSVCAALNCIPLYRIAERTLGRTCGLCAGWLWACGIIFMRWPTTWVWETGLSALLLSIAFWLALQLAEFSSLTRWTGFGLFWGVAALINPSLLTFLPFSALWPAYHLLRKGKPWLRPILLAAITFVAVISPWLIRNRMVFDKWVFIRGNAPFEFSLGNYTGSTGLGWFGKHPTQNTRELNSYAHLGEVAYVSTKGKDALRFVQARPAEFLSLTGRRFWAMWYGTYLNYSSARIEPWRTWTYWPLSLTTFLGLIAITIRRKKAAWLFAAAIIVYPLPYYLTFAQPRYRHPIEPLMLIVSSYVLMELANDVKGHFRKTASTYVITEKSADEPVCVAVE